MADRDTRLNIDITAQDRATDELRKVGAEVADLEGPHTVTVDADDNATPVLDDVDAAADELDGRTATVGVQADVDEARRLLDQADATVRELDGRRAEVTVTADISEARRLLDQVESRLRDLDGRRAGLSVGGAAAAGAAGGAVGAGIPLVAEAVAGATALSNQTFQIEALARTTGSTREEASRLARVWQDAGLDLTDLLDLMANLQQVIRDQPDLREQLNLSLANDGVTTFLQTIQAINTEITNPGDQSKAKGTLFGEEGQRQVEQLLIMVRDDLGGAMDDIAASRIIDDQDLDNARELTGHARDAANWYQRAQQFALQAVALSVSKEFDDTLFAGAMGALGVPRNTGLTEEQITNRNLGYGPLGNPAAPPSTRQGPIITNVYNPPGTPSTTNQQQQQYYARNGTRLS